MGLRVKRRPTRTAVTADERNRTLKYGQEVPRSWIADFNVTH
jgi:hypothetical protein